MAVQNIWDNEWSLLWFEILNRSFLEVMPSLSVLLIGPIYGRYHRPNFHKTIVWGQWLDSDKQSANMSSSWTAEWRFYMSKLSEACHIERSPWLTSYWMISGTVDWGTSTWHHFIIRILHIWIILFCSQKHFDMLKWLNMQFPHNSGFGPFSPIW